MELHKISISIIIMSMLILGVTFFLNDVGTNYSQADFKGLENTQATLDTQINISKDLERQIDIITLQEDTNVLLIPYALIKAGWNLVKITFSPLWTLGSLISDISSESSSLGIPLPDWLIVSIKAILWITLAAILIYAFFKWKFQD